MQTNHKLPFTLAMLFSLIPILAIAGLRFYSINATYERNMAKIEADHQKRMKEINDEFNRKVEDINQKYLNQKEIPEYIMVNGYPVKTINANDIPPDMEFVTSGWMLGQPDEPTVIQTWEEMQKSMKTQETSQCSSMENP